MEGLLAGIFKAFPRQSPMVALGAGLGIIVYFTRISDGFELLTEAMHLMFAAGFALFGGSIGYIVGEFINFAHKEIKSWSNPRRNSPEYFKKTISRLSPEQRKFLQSSLAGNMSRDIPDYSSGYGWIKNELMSLGIIKESDNGITFFRRVDERAFDAICKNPEILGLRIEVKGNRRFFSRLR